MGFYENIPPLYTGGNTVWDMTNAPEIEQRKMLATLSADASWLPQKSESKENAMIKSIMFHSFCESCGKERAVSFIPMQRGHAWYCFPCQVRYMVRTWRWRKQIREAQSRACHNTKVEGAE